MSIASAPPAAKARPDGASDTRIIGTVGLAHFTSHMLQLTFAPLFAMMRDDLGVSYAQLGLLLTVFYAASGLGQVAAGVLVDRYGAHRLLIGGVVLHAGSVAAMAFAPTYLVLLPLAALAGLGNSVYHPADLTILSHRVSQAKLGRAFAFHVIAGTAGFALSPVASALIASSFGWRASPLAIGVFGLLVAVVLMASRPAIATAAQAGRRAVEGAQAVPFRAIVAMPVVILGFCYFTLSSFSGTGIQSFSITAFMQGYGATLAAATLAITLYQVGNAVGVWAGGVMADRMSSHRAIAAGGLAASALLGFGVAVTALPFWAVTALLVLSGAAMGVTMPSRDVLVRRAAPPNAVGKVFGIVYSGFDIGALAAPLAHGFLLDHQMAPAIFVVSSLALILGIPTVLGFGSRANVAAAARG